MARTNKLPAITKGPKRPKLKLELRHLGFTKYLMKNWGPTAFTENGTIKLSVIDDILNDPKYSKHVKRMAQFAKNSRDWKKK